MKNYKKIKIKDVEWKFILFTPKGYERKFGKEDSYAITFPAEREVYFNISHATPGIVRHELVHVMLASTCTDSATLSGAKVEEVLAEIIEVHFLDMIYYMMELIVFIEAYSGHLGRPSRCSKSYIDKVIVILRDKKKSLEAPSLIKKDSDI